MISAKYIVFTTPEELTFPVVFGPSLNHSDMARMVKSVFPGYQPKSAGFVTVAATVYDRMAASAFGESLTLGLQSSEDDSRLLTSLLQEQ